MATAHLEALAHLAEMGTPPDDGAAVLDVSAGLRESLERLELETLPFVAGGGSEIQFVFGPYGRGKTHFLKAVSEWVRQRGFVTAYVDCMDGQSPFMSLIETYRAIAARMTPPETHEFFGTTGIAQVVEAQFTDRDPAGQRALITHLKADKALSPDFRNLVLAYCTEGVVDGSDEYLADTLKALLAHIPTYRVTLGTLYRKYPHLPRPLGKLARRNAAVWLRSLVSLPRALGYRGLLVLFDETETVLLRSRRRRQQAHLAHIRTFVDHMATGAFRGCAIYYAVTEEFIDIADRNLGALSQRIERVQVPEMDDTRNPRAIWVGIDELTRPGPQDPRFFEELAERIVHIGRKSGLDHSDATRIRALQQGRARRYAEDINEGRVRDFVKETAALVLRNVNDAGVHET